jgi:hypothetical protein
MRKAVNDSVMNRAHADARTRAASPQNGIVWEGMVKKGMWGEMVQSGSEWGAFLPVKRFDSGIRLFAFLFIFIVAG